MMDELIIQPVAKVYPRLLTTINDLLVVAVQQSADDVTVDYVISQVENGSALLWVVSSENARGIIVTTVIPQGRASALLVWLIAGEAVVVYSRQIQARLEQFAKETGCSEIKAVVNNKKLENHMLAHLGYQYGGAVLYKEMNHGRHISRSEN